MLFFCKKMRSSTYGQGHPVIYRIIGFLAYKVIKAGNLKETRFTFNTL